MNLPAAALVLLFSSLPLAAQTAGFGIAAIESTGGPAETLAASPSARAGAGCPVWMRLQQTLGGRLESVQNGKRTEDSATRLYLTLSTPAFGPMAVHGVRSAMITVYRLNGRQHLELIGPGPTAMDAGVPRSLKVQFDRVDGKSVADLWLADFGPVSFLEVNSLVYADGSVWEPSPGQSCRVTPDPFELVSGHR
ncbi:MAG TPA: hypothetical protein VMA34_14860 [Terracidiphilus sp.]|nr:hypothetical protein [Terracidiphilus sp.]